MIREKKTISGKLLEVDYYPVIANGNRLPLHPPKHKRSTAEQERYNRNQAIKKLIRLVNTNFDTGDILMHPTYEQSKAPRSEKEARKDITNYLRRVKRKRDAELKRVSSLLASRPDDAELQKQYKQLNKPFKYIYVIEKQTYKSGKYKGSDNWHFHLFMTGGISRDTLEDMWPDGVRCNADRFQPEKFGPESAARYMSKDPMGAHRFCCSKNLVKSTERAKDGQISARGVERLCKQRVDDREYWERKYKGYRFIRCFPRHNSYNGQWYLSVVMYKADKNTELPDWRIDEWET